MLRNVHQPERRDPFLVCLSAATLVFLFFAIAIYRKEEEMASLFKLKVLLSLSLSRLLAVELFLNDISSCQNRHRTKKDGRRAVYLDRIYEDV